MTVAPIVEVCTKYRQGVRGMLKSQVEHLLHKYLEVEQEFQVRSLKMLSKKIVFKTKMFTVVLGFGLDLNDFLLKLYWKLICTG